MANKKQVYKYPNVSLDACIFLDALKPSEPFHSDAAQIFEFAEQGSLIIAVSTIIIPEMTYLDKNNPDRGPQIEKIRRYLSQPFVHIHPVITKIGEIAQQIRASYTLRSADAVHLATTAYLGVEYLLTRDGAGASNRSKLIPLSDKIHLKNDSSNPCVKIMCASDFIANVINAGTVFALIDRSSPEVIEK